jgi:hypothetical protein
MTFGRLSIYICIVLAAISMCSTARAQEMGKLKGTLLGPDGTAMANFSVHLRWNARPPAGGVITGKQKPPRKAWQPRKKWLVVDSDDSGQFSITLPAGNWDVIAYADAFAPTCAVALIEEGKTTTLDLRFPGYAPMSLI